MFENTLIPAICYLHSGANSSSYANKLIWNLKHANNSQSSHYSTLPEYGTPNSSSDSSLSFSHFLR